MNLPDLSKVKKICYVFVGWMTLITFAVACLLLSSC